LLTDLRLALRSISKTGGFAATAVLTLGLGMMLCTSAIVVAKAYLLRNLPYPAAERLYDVRYGAPGQSQPREMEALDWASLGDVIEQPIAWDLDAFYLIGGSEAELVPGAWVTPGFVEGLGIQAALGRGFDRESFAQGSANVALISHRLWNSRFGGDPNIVGRTFTAYVSDRPQEAEAFTILGVLPSGFWHVNSYTDILTPLRAPTYPYMVRLREGVTAENAIARITALVRAGARNVPQNWTPQMTPSHELYVQSVRPMLQSVTTAAALVLLVACANIAGLLLVRATRRQKEIAVRTALGAGRAAIARMLLAEALVLGAVSMALALAATRFLLGWLAPQIQQQLGRRVPGGAQAFAIDGWTLALAGAIGLTTVVVCTLAPLLSGIRPDLLGALQSGSRTATEGHRSQRIRAALIAVEIAASLALVAGSTLMLRSVVNLLRTDLGFSADRVLLASVTLRQHRYPDSASRMAMFDRIASRLGAIPGTEAVGLTTAWPMQQPRMYPAEVIGTSERVSVRTGIHRVNDLYFSALGIRLAAGRAFTSADRAGSEPIAVVSESLARRLWPAGNGIGGRLLVPEEQERGQPISISRTVVGIVRDVRQGPSDEELGDVYIPLLQSPGRFTFVLMRTAGSPVNWLSAFRSAFREIDPEVAVQNARPLQTTVDELSARPRVLASLLTAFAIIAALVALVGVYGVIAYAVRQREREIAVRMALGADPARLTRLFVRQGAMILLAGLILGLFGAIVTGRVLESQLLGVTSHDPLALAGAELAFATAGLFAIWWPSRRAAATDPASALRAE
jgi:putative ABC transport system permease protein